MTKGIEIHNVKGDPKAAEVLIYDFIGSGFFEDGVTAKQFAEDLRDFGDIETLNVRINSPGGSVADGIAIYNTIRRHPADVTVDIDGAAWSIASVIAMAGNVINMADNALMMVHDPSAGVYGTAEDMRKAADMLDKGKETIMATYSARTGLPDSAISALMSDETWMTADEANEQGFVDNVTESLRIAASFEIPSNLKIPPRHRAKVDSLFLSAPQGKVIKMPETPTADTTPQVATLKELKAAFPKADDSFFVAMLDREATIEQAQSAWQQDLESRLEAADKRAAEAQAKADEEAAARKAAEDAASKPPGKKPGNQSLADAAGEDAGPVADGTAQGTWEAMVDAEADKLSARRRRMSPVNIRAEAMRRVNRKHPGLQEQVVAEANA